MPTNVIMKYMFGNLLTTYIDDFKLIFLQDKNIWFCVWKFFGVIKGLNSKKNILLKASFAHPISDCVYGYGYSLNEISNGRTCKNI